MSLLFIIPIAGALAFPALTFLLQRSMGKTRDLWGILVVSNVATALVFVPPFLFQSDFSAGAWYQPMMCGALFFIGQAAGYKSFATGDLSVAVPLQGSKVLLVALLAFFFLRQPAGWNIWIAALLIPAAVYFLGEHAPGKREDRKYRATLLQASIASIAFAALDVGIQAWAPRWGVWRFGFWTFLFQAVLSLGLFLVPGRAGRAKYTVAAWRDALAGSVGMAVVSLGLVWVISASGRAAWVNILFNSRVLWSVLFIGLAGRWMGMREACRPGARPLLVRRFLGAVLMMASILLAVL